MIDLDRFKNINDTLGHTIGGDQLLREVAELLNTSLNPCDTLSNTNGEIDLNSCDTIARIGGDEFVVVLNGVDEIQASKKANDLLQKLSTPLFVEGYEIYTSLSIGISIFPSDGQTAETLLKNADIAMYQVKAQGRNSFRFFSPPDMNKRSIKRLEMENNLRYAIERGELFLEYQPQVNVQNRQLFGGSNRSSDGSSRSWVSSDLTSL